MRIFLAALLLIAMFSSACSRPRPPKEGMATARLAVQEAGRAEAPKFAPEDYALAQSKLSLAEASIERDEFKQARRYSEQATVDARFAQTRAEAQKAELAAVQNEKTTQSLKKIR